jgi:hypothetical protein
MASVRVKALRIEPKVIASLLMSHIRDQASILITGWVVKSASASCGSSRNVEPNTYKNVNWVLFALAESTVFFMTEGYYQA